MSGIGRQDVLGQAGSTENVPQFTGAIYYVDGVNGDDSNSGITPFNTLATIGAAIGKLNVGDGIEVKATTYTETGLDLNVDNCKIWFEHGTVIDPSSGTGLIVSANHCKINGDGRYGFTEGASRIDPAANETGMEITGNFCYINTIRVQCSSIADIGFDITGTDCVLNGCRSSDPLVAAFQIQGDRCKLFECCTGGTPANNSIGFWVTNSCDKARIKNCSSQGHATAGFQIDSGCTNGVIINCESGGKDGKIINNANASDCLFSDMHFQGDDGDYNSPITKDITFTNAGGQDNDGKHYRLFKVTGTIRLIDIGGVVSTVLSATSTVPNIELTSINATIELTDTTGGSDITGAVVGAILVRLDVSTEPLFYSNPDSTPAVAENTSKFSNRNVVEIIEDDSADTYVTLRLTNTLAGGAMTWAARYLPITVNGFLEPA